jgi:hypothetical protein
VEVFDYNAVGDANAHNWAIAPGAHGMISVIPKFRNPTLMINTSFPSSLSNSEKLDWLRNQVHQKLGLAADSPLVDVGAILPDMNVQVSGLGPDLGALETR